MPVCINSRFSSLFSGDMFRFKAISKSLTVFALASLISAYHHTHLDGRKHKAVPRELCCLFLCVCECVRYRDWHKPSVFRAWSNSFNGLPAVHSKVWFCSAEWEQEKKKIPNNLLCCLCLASLVIVCNLFPTLGYCEPFFSIFQWLTFFFSVLILHAAD